MIVYVVVGGMKGTTYVQIVKAFMLMIGALVMTLLVLVHYKFNLSTLLGDAAASPARAGLPRAGPAVRRGEGDRRETFYSKMDLSRSASRWCSARPACRTS
jgi:cation/acetate symporter